MHIKANPRSSTYLLNTSGEVNKYFFFLKQGHSFTLLKIPPHIQYQYSPAAIQATKH